MLQLEDILEATGGSLLEKGGESFKAISVDSRTIKDGEIFLALRGQRFDGHDFLKESLKRGSGAIIDNYEKVTPLVRGSARTLVLVENTLGALERLATFLRKRFIREMVAVTGSNGKTTTKELLWSILSKKGISIKNPGNLNNEIGLPLSIINGISMYGPAQYGVYEMGASKPGDIRHLCEIALPDYGIVTNIGPAHLEGMGSIDGVLRTKTEMAEFVKVLFINGDDKNLMNFYREHGSLTKLDIIRFGFSRDCSVRAEAVRHGPGYSIYTLSVHMESKDSKTLRFDAPVRLKIPGVGNIYNSLAGISVALYLGLPVEDAIKAVEEFSGVEMRLELREVNQVYYIIDAYNANPDSMKNAIRELVKLKESSGRTGRGRAIAVLGDMLELGPYSELYHRELGRFIHENNIDLFIAVGTEMKKAFEEFLTHSKDKEAFSTLNPEEAGRLLLGLVRPGDTVLIKGSRVMAMEKVLKELEYAC